MTERIIVPGRRLGRQPTPPALLAKIPKLAHYIALPTPPAGPLDVTQGITSWPVFLNDRLGDCVCAAAAHMVEIFGAESTGSPKILTDQDVLALYEMQGYVPGNAATDRGSDLGNVLGSWKNGWAADKILAYATIDVRDRAMLKTALWLFSGLFIAVELPITAQNQSTWDVTQADPSQNGPGTWGGHGINVVQLDDAGLTIITWGAPKRMTWRFWDEYVVECYAVVPADYDLLQGKPIAQVGFNEQQLLADMAELAS